MSQKKVFEYGLLLVSAHDFAKEKRLTRRCPSSTAQLSINKEFAKRNIRICLLNSCQGHGGSHGSDKSWYVTNIRLAGTISTRCWSGLSLS